MPGAGFYNGSNRPGNDAFRGNYQETGQTDLGFGTQYEQLWTTQGVVFNNNYTQNNSNSNFDSWSGFSWSNVSDTTTPGSGNQYAAITGGGSDGAGGVAAGSNYAMTFGAGAFINVPTGRSLASVDITNSTYAYLSMRDGDAFAKNFGGESGNDPDLFQLTLTGFDATGGTGNSIGSVTVDLADYRFADNSQDFILDSWQTIDTTALAGAQSIGLSYTSTDVGGFGINTPLYAAMDNFAFVPEPSSAAMLLFGALGLLRHRRRS
ncbi:MAG: DUF4465 domain-containing protein [Planctomycetota bacterium]